MDLLSKTNVFHIMSGIMTSFSDQNASKFAKFIRYKFIDI